jgi:hypothetical protein
MMPMVLAIAIVGEGITGAAAQMAGRSDTSLFSERSRPSPVDTRAPGVWPRLHVPDPVAHVAARKALDAAWQLLGRSGCAAMLEGFNDEAGRPLTERLAALSVDLQTYLTMVLFIDGTREDACATGVFGFTSPGSRVVRLCVGELKRTAQLDLDVAAASFIHEMLHTLGLGENPPSSRQITRRVLSACLPDRS